VHAQWIGHEIARRQDLYKQFIEQASKCYVHARHDEADIAGLVELYAKLGTMRVLSSPKAPSLLQLPVLAPEMTIPRCVTTRSRAMRAALDNTGLLLEHLKLCLFTVAPEAEIQLMLTEDLEWSSWAAKLEVQDPRRACCAEHLAGIPEALASA
jgi:hypothetical protein